MATKRPIQNLPVPVGQRIRTFEESQGCCSLRWLSISNQEEAAFESCKAPFKTLMRLAHKARSPDLRAKRAYVRAIDRRVVVCVLLVSVLLSTGCRANGPRVTAPTAIGIDAERGFLLWKIEDAAAA